MATDLEEFVRQDGRAEATEQIARRIDAEGITYVYFQFVSVTGPVMGTGIPAAHWTSTATKGFQLVYGATTNLFIDRQGQYLGYGPEACELVGLPDVDTFCPLPSDPTVARVFCTLFRGREEVEGPGSSLTSDCRGNLHRLHQEFRPTRRQPSGTGSRSYNAPTSGSASATSCWPQRRGVGWG